MSYNYFSHNGSVLPIEDAVVPLSRVEYSYGFGVYESVRVSKGKIHFLDEHCQRLMNSAEIISLEHSFSIDFVKKAIKDLVEKNQPEACNLKILLIGGSKKEEATLDILCLNPHFPDRKMYKQGVHCITYEYERPFPGAKTLNMLSSYLAFRKAREAGAYDALLVNRDGCITEGTRTNFFAVKDKTLISPPEKDILPGVTRAHVIKIAKQEGFDVQEKEISLSEVGHYESAFITNTSAKILPLKSINQAQLNPATPQLAELLRAFDSSLS